MAAGEFAQVKNHLERGLGLMSETRVAVGGDHDLYAMLADASARERDHANLKKFTGPAEEHANRLEHRLYQGVAHRARAVEHTLEGQFDQAADRLARAMQIFEDLDTQWQLGRCLFEWGQLEQARDDKKSAHGHYMQALRVFDRLGAKPFADQTRRAMESLF